jgi:hypothetical protein
MIPCLRSLAALLLLATTVSLRAADDEMEKSPIYERNLTAEVTFSRDSKKINPAFDTRIQTIAPTIKITNKVVKESYEGLQTELFVIGESVTREKFYVLLINHRAAFDLGPKEAKEIPAGFARMYYDRENTYRYGVKYDCYVLILRDKDGKLVTIKSTKSSFSSRLADLMKLRTGDVFDKNLQKIPGRSYWTGTE